MKEFLYQPRKIYYRKNDFLPGRKTLVFVHGISGSSSAWLPYEKKFEDRFNVLTFDLRGHGKSWKPKGFNEYAIKKFADDLHELVLSLGMDKFILIGHSFGVLVLLEFMTTHLDMIERVVFLSPSFAPHKILSGKIVKPFLVLANIFRLLPFKEEGRSHVDYSSFKNTGDWNIPRMIADIGATSLPVYLYGTRHSYNVNYENLLDRIEVPTLIIHGRRDSIFPVGNAMEMHKKIKNSQLIIIENSDHILVLNNFPEVSGAIDEFVGEA